MRTLHLALAVSSIEQSVADYSARLREPPVLIVPGEYALWRTAALNLSIRKTNEPAGTMRHLGWEDTEAEGFSIDADCNGITWERFSASQQAQEIQEIWPNTDVENLFP